MKKITLAITAELMAQMGLSDGADEMAAATAIKNLSIKAAKVDTIQAQLVTVQQKNTELETEITSLKNAGNTEKVKNLLDAALEGNKITVAVSKRLATDYATNPDGLKDLLEGMAGYTSVVDQISEEERKGGNPYAGKSWDEVFESGKMEDMKKNYPKAYKELYKGEFGEEPK